MSNILIDKTYSLGAAHQISADIQKLFETSKQFKIACDQKGYESPLSFIHLPEDNHYIENIQKLTATKKKLEPVLVVVIGIGGSNLGTQAVYDAIGQDTKIPLYFADTVDSQHIARLLLKVECVLKDNKKVVIVGISKSGSTTETIANFECFLALLIQYQPTTFQEQLVVISDQDSAFWKLAHEKKIDVLPIPAKVGGRFSVLSAVGLFPLGLVGIDIGQLCKGAQKITQECLNESEKNPAAIFASLLAYHYSKGMRIHDLFLFNSCLESLGKWQRQLIGESLGKPTRSGKPMGITPTVSMGSTDLHSVGQLYLGGPDDRVTSFVWVEKEDTRVMIPNMPEFNMLVSHIQHKPLHTIMKAIFDGTQKAYINARRPFITIRMPEKNAFYIGQFLQMNMIATVYLGALMDVNSFDQPQVELYKQTTREILAHE